MRQFASSGFRIWNLSREAKLVYTCFGLFSLVALGSSALLYEDMVGAGTPGIGAYYHGSSGHGSSGHGSPGHGSFGHGSSDTGSAGGRSLGRGSRGDQPGARATDGAGKGPTIDMPADDAEPARPITVAVSYRKLLETTHFHLFTVPVFLLIIAHLFMLTGLESRTKIAWIAGGWASAALHLLAPWLVRWGGSGWAWSYAVSGTALGVTSLVLTLYPIGAMWLGGPSRGEGRGRAREAARDDSRPL